MLAKTALLTWLAVGIDVAQFLVGPSREIIDSRLFEGRRFSFFHDRAPPRCLAIHGPGWPYAGSPAGKR